MPEIETPSVIVDYARLLKNLRLMQQTANAVNVKLRPHIKTHKCLEIARLQLEFGAVGITASKPDEALVFMEAGVRSVTVAYPVIETGKIDRLLAAARTLETDLRMMADSEIGIEALSESACAHGRRLDVFLKIDVGLHRCGVPEDDPRLIPLVKQIHEDENLRFAGLLSHAGHAYAARSRDEVAAVAQQECELLQRVVAKINDAGIEVPEVSVGSTPTALASNTFKGITEIRPGNYVFMDLTPVKMGLLDTNFIALSVMATVVSVNDDYLIVDAGSKVLTSDLGAHGAGPIPTYGLAFPGAMPLVKLSEEHGWIKHGGEKVPIGTQLCILPNHACPVANLADSFTVLRADGAIETWPVDARGRVR